MLTDTSFHVKVLNDEIITYYEVVPKGASFNLAYNNTIFASIMLRGRWQQTAGIKLPAKQLQIIGKQISVITRRRKKEGITALDLSPAVII